MNTSYKVELPGHGIFWYLPDKEFGDDGALAPLEHYTDKGEVTQEAAWEGDSYAHIFGGVIKRFNKPIGRVSDLIVLEKFQY